MNKRSITLALLLTACGGSPQPEPAVATTESAARPKPEVTPPPPVAEPVKVEPTPEEKKKAEAKKALEADREKMTAAQNAENARWTPELKKAAKALADASYPSGKAAITAVLAGKHRRPGNADRDKYRHPLQTLEFFGFTPTMTVLEYGPGEGWYTEVLAPAVAKKGKLLATNGDPNGPVDERGTFYAQRFKMFLDGAPEVYGKVETVTIDGKNPKLGHAGQVDLALVIRGLHGMVNNGKMDTWLSEIHGSLKPKGVLGIVQHRAAEGAKAEETSKKGYLPEKWVIEKIEAAGFKLQGKSEINANPKDTKDYPEGVWALPPTFERGDKDRATLAAIGESDRMTLKFVKVEKK